MSDASLPSPSGEGRETRGTRPGGGDDRYAAAGDFPTPDPSPEGKGRHPTPPILTVVAAALVDADGRVLVAERPAGKHLAGQWEFPGGKVEPGETPEAALVRELAEELGIDTHASCLAPAGFASHPYPDFHLVLLLFACRKWRGTPRGRDGQRLAWHRPNALFALDMPPADRPLLGLLAALLLTGPAGETLQSTHRSTRP